MHEQKLENNNVDEQKDSLLYARIIAPDVNTIQKALSHIDGLPPITVDGMISDILARNITSPYFLASNVFLSRVENRSLVTYPVGGDLTIGVGLDLKKNKNTAKALFQKIRPDINWDIYYPKMCQEVGQPVFDGVPLLSDTDITYLLYYSLIGFGSFVGYTTQLKARLSPLGSTAFLPSQLLALQSQVFNRPDLIGPGMIAALKYWSSTGNDLQGLIEIIEYCNGGITDPLDIVIQNRRLLECGLFHGNASDVHLNWRQ